jgi:fermentation-respiration switch protein FrsA (DUF1100 family)
MLKHNLHFLLPMLILAGCVNSCTPPVSPIGKEPGGAATATKPPPSPSEGPASTPAASPADHRPLGTATALKPPSGPLASLERSMLFFPVRYPSGDWHPAGLAFEDAWFQAADGTNLHGWFVPHERPKAAVLYCHGNGGNVAYWAGAAKELHDRAHVSVLLFDYRGYGRSEGEPFEAGVLADARAARAWLARRERIAENRVVLLGRSLGGGVAVDLAAADGARALVLESTFTSVPDVAQSMYPLLPVRLLAKTQLNSAAKIANYHGPLLQSHGTADRLIPYSIGRKLFDRANEPKQFVTIAGGDHNDPQTDEYYAILAAFLDRLK